MRGRCRYRQEACVIHHKCHCTYHNHGQGTENMPFCTDLRERGDCPMEKLPFADQNMLNDLKYAPYCMRCMGLQRMVRVSATAVQCPVCSARHEIGGKMIMNSTIKNWRKATTARGTLYRDDKRRWHQCVWVYYGDHGETLVWDWLL